jgi:hypothetical protein
MTPKVSNDEGLSSTDVNTMKRYLSSANREQLLEMIPELSALLKRARTEWWWMEAGVYAAFERHGFHVTQDSFYSPLPNTVELAGRYQNVLSEPISAAERLCNADSFFVIWKEACSFADELAAVPWQMSQGYYWDNPFFPNIDAIVYYGLIRSRRPSRVVEIGSGFSSHIAAMALRRNGEGELRLVDPYPTEQLRELVLDRVCFDWRRIQDVPSDFFEAVHPGDFLLLIPATSAKSVLMSTISCSR